VLAMAWPFGSVQVLTWQSGLSLVWRSRVGGGRFHSWWGSFWPALTTGLGSFAAALSSVQPSGVLLALELELCWSCGDVALEFALAWRLVTV
jgi:hypothetical protein